MFSSRIAAHILVLATILVNVPAVAQHSPASHFIPGYTFEGSQLGDWQAVGQADWQAENGVITGTADGGGGLLLFDRGFQDVAVFSRFRCSADCDAGVLLRAEDTSSGLNGILVALNDGTSTVHRVTIDDNGRIRNSELASDPADEGGGPQWMETPRIEPGEWNSISIMIESNTIHNDLNEVWDALPEGTARDVPQSASSGTVAHYEDVTFGFGPIALYVGSGTVEFDDVSTKNLLRHDTAPEMSSDRFRVQRLNPFTHAWGADVGDVNNDGVLDVVSGPFYYLGPDYRTRHEIYPSRTYNPGEEFVPDMITFSDDFTGDGWDDVLATESRELALYVNPRGERRHWTRHDALPDICSEIVIKHDLDADGEPEFVYAGNDYRLAYGEPDPDNPTGVWQVHHVSEEIGGNRCMNHGMGVGDVNGDGRDDILNPFGWWEQPAAGPDKGPWIHHEQVFGRASAAFGGGGAISVYDFNGDGLNDVVSAMEAHGWGLAWYEQTRNVDGDISFVKHSIFENFATQNAGNVALSQLHSGAILADVDQDGIQDFVTGKRHWSHLNHYSDPDHNGEAVVYWYRTVRDADAPGGVRFEPELIHNKSGVGSEIMGVDINRDGATDFVSSGTHGTFIFWGTPEGG